MTNNTSNATIFKALCDEKRLSIILLLKNGECCACHIAETLDLPQSSLSYHMKILCDSNIVSSREQGKWTHYHLNSVGCNIAIDRLNSLLSTSNNTSEGQQCK